MTRKSLSRRARDVASSGPARSPLRIGKAGIVRFSTIVSNARKGPNGPAIAGEIENAHRVTSPVCKVHGKLADPVLAISDGKPIFACPWCLGGEILEKWQAEGRLSR